MVNIKNKIRGIKEIWNFENRWQLLFNRVFFSNERINIYRYKDLEILIDHSAGDANGAREVLTSDMYQKYFQEMNLPGEINLLDRGSNNGGFPLLVKSNNIEIKRLVCVEFNPKTYSRMRFNIERNINCEFFPLNVALNKENKSLNVNFGNTSTSDSLYSKIQDKSTTVKIEGRTFNKIYKDHFENQKVDVCKLDVEGAEFEVFAGNDFDELKNCHYLLIEIHHNKQNHRELVRNKILELGFKEFDRENKDDELHYVHFFINKNTF